ncbi:MAG: hypothetical protein K1V76_06875 [Candidatus Amulumruptor sp.]
MEKLPPLEKVYEAWSAIADQRVAMTETPSDDMASGNAVVASSDGEKLYHVNWDGDTYASDDNATYWQRYAGYPVIAVLMLQGRLPLDIPESNLWSGINWHQLNEANKRDYAAAAREAMADNGINPAMAQQEADKVISALKNLPLTLKRKRTPRN